MHKLQMYENLRDMLEKEVKEIEKQDSISESSLDVLTKLLTAIKVTDKCIEREQGGGMSNAYAYQGGSYNNGMSNNYSRMPYMTRGGSYAYDGMSGARRGRDGDGDGRYSEDSFRNSQDRGWGSYENSFGYSQNGSKQMMLQRLEMLMEEPMNESDRAAIMDCINKIK